MQTAIKIVNKIADVCVIIGAIFVSAMALMITADVCVRLVLDSPIKGSYELVQIMFGVSVFTGLIASQRWKTHIQISLFIRLLPGNSKFIIVGIMNLLGTVISGVISYALFSQAAKAVVVGTMTDVLAIPLYPFYYLFGTMMIFFTIQLFLDTLKTFMAMKNETYANEITEAWI